MCSGSKGSSCQVCVVLVLTPNSADGANKCFYIMLLTLNCLDYASTYQTHWGASEAASALSFVCLAASGDHPRDAVAVLKKTEAASLPAADHWVMPERAACPVHSTVAACLLLVLA